MPVLSHHQAQTRLDAHAAGQAVVAVSLDLWLTESTVALGREGARLPDGQLVPWEALQEIAGTETVCFAIREGAAEKIQRFSRRFNRLYSLFPTRRAPTMLVSGIPMHRIKGIDPHEDTLRKIAAIAPVTGSVLDCTMGLGYTAIQAAKTAGQVTTIELDPAVVEICEMNPWSRALFDNPRITRMIGSAYEQIREVPGGAYACIFHDPPTFKLAGELYSGEFYRQLCRVLRPGGKLFHYIGDLESRHGATVARGAMRRLQDAGFKRVLRRPEAFGLAAFR